MSYARRDDRHNDDLVDEIADGFERTLKEKREDSEGNAKPAGPGFVITGDARNTPKPRRRDR
ncbi:hypothetical protein VSH64_42705 [Amycolatopsis rhabdoformis]|uniref:DUF5302 domain-containing protein n=1 Tax=Amycolatopsis rhabdoformis TaxID=1448059 RepID=A0ABZ1I4T5_9PSEU|nr:hypothetical protein [Amycolatopsis rhabdoformis]WSE29444.1 hypothetical protein VSH64_42705 [Amycolatopsis rhabdoformis]